MTRCSLALLIGLYACPGVAAATAAHPAAPGNFNPIVPGYFADPTLKRFGDTFYLYATTDGNGGGRGPATVWVSQDFVHWVLVPMNWPTSPHYWAPDVVRRPDGRYYLFYNQPCNTYAGVSASPAGPWTPLTPSDGLVIRDRLIPEVITLDTQIFEDRDGTLYAYWGTWGIFPNSGCGIGVLNPDMKSFARFGLVPNTQAKDFFEAPYMLERNGVYYLTYSSGSCHDASYRVQYAVSDRPDGQFTMGANNPILATTPDQSVHGPGHHSVLQLGDEWYIIYHRHDIPVTPNGMHRQTCADRLVFQRDGVIRQVEPTHRGIGYLGPPSCGPNLAFCQPVTASSHYRDTLRGHEYKPEFAVDDNNATLWRPGDNRPGHWLQVDLGSPQRVRRTETQFEYGTWYYQYLIEYSLDGERWSLFADRRQNTRWGSPLVDDGDVQTRYLRLMVTGTELPGLFGAVWNFKAFTAAPADPLLALADQAFAQFVKSAGGQSLAQAPASAEAGPRPPLIHLDAADLQLGQAVSEWANQGSLGGVFASRAAAPRVDLAGGRKAVRFSGRQVLTASFPAPSALAGNSSFTVAAWVNNPEIAESECIVSWAGRGGPDATTAQFGYGTHHEFGAVGHWGFADMGFRDAVPPAGAWQHLAVVFDGVVERVYVNGQQNNAEAKMLLMNAGQSIHVGASVPGTEHLDGYLASLRIYDTALDTAEVKKLAAEPPSADVLLHVDAGQLDYGPLASWTSSGSAGGAFAPAGAPPVVQDVDGRIAVQFAPGQTLTWTADPGMPARDFTLLVDVASPPLQQGSTPLELVDGRGRRTALPLPLPDGAWHQLALVYRAGAGACFLDGAATAESVPPPPAGLGELRLGGAAPWAGAVGRVQWFSRALAAEELARLHQHWARQWQRPTPHPAAFAARPTAGSPTLVAMSAERGRSEWGSVQYRFTEITGNPGGSSSGWTPQPFFLDDGLLPGTRYVYTVVLRDALGNVTAAAEPAEVVTAAAGLRLFADDFTTPRDFLADGVSGTIWDGCLGQDEGSAAETLASREGRLRLQSRGTVWDGGQPRGPFLYKLAPGDFVLQAAVADYAGLATRRVPGNNDGGLMVRVPRAQAAGRGEDLLQLNFFPIWNQGNMVTSLDRSGRRQIGNRLAWDAHRHLQIIRQGGRFYFRTSADGVDWQDLPGSPVERSDLEDQPLQVGLYHASYGSDSSYVSFADCRLWTAPPAAETP